MNLKTLEALCHASAAAAVEATMKRDKIPESHEEFEIQRIAIGAVSRGIAHLSDLGLLKPWIDFDDYEISYAIASTAGVVSACLPWELCRGCDEDGNTGCDECYESGHRFEAPICPTHGDRILIDSFGRYSCPPCLDARSQDYVDATDGQINEAAWIGRTFGSDRDEWESATLESVTVQDLLPGYHPGHLTRVRVMITDKIDLIADVDLASEIVYPIEWYRALDAYTSDRRPVRHVATWIRAVVLCHAFQSRSEVFDHKGDRRKAS